MLPFSTEFPLKPASSRAAFVAEVIAWLQGTSYSTVLALGAEAELDGENAHLRSPTGEELRLRELRDGDDWSAVGFRHDFPDEEGRLWRTEGVLKRSAGVGAQELVRLRTQCFARTPGAHLESPRKPYLVKSLLKNGWGGNDNLLSISDQPFWLKENKKSLETAKAITLGEATRWLPILYISASDNNRWILNRREIEKLAYDLGGVAHVVVEPNRAFSLRLRNESDGRNVYGGTLGLSAPGAGIVKRYYLRWQMQGGKDLSVAVRAAASSMRSQMPAFGWDWTELQEQALRAHREREKKRLTAAENERLYLEEIENLQDKIGELERQISAHADVNVGRSDSDFEEEGFARQLGPEIYLGEISDRLRFAAKMTLDIADQIGLDGRTKSILGRVVERLRVAPALSELSRDLERATKDPRRVASELVSLLRQHGYVEKSHNKHIRLEAAEGFDGLEPLTIPTTPSENRGLINLRKQIERAIGINRLTN